MRPVAKVLAQKAEIHLRVHRQVRLLIDPLTDIFADSPPYLRVDRQAWGILAPVETQKELNDLYAGLPYEIDERYPYLLNTLFVSLFYSAGLPLLMPFAALNFALYFAVDKYLLLRVYSKPYFDQTLALMTLRLLPFALLFHLGIAFWMYGSRDIFHGPDLLTDSGGGGGGAGGGAAAANAANATVDASARMLGAAASAVLSTGPLLQQLQQLQQLDLMAWVGGSSSSTSSSTALANSSTSTSSIDVDSSSTTTTTTSTTTTTTSSSSTTTTTSSTSTTSTSRSFVRLLAGEGDDHEEGEGGAGSYISMLREFDPLGTEKGIVTRMLKANAFPFFLLMLIQLTAGILGSTLVRALTLIIERVAALSGGGGAEAMLNESGSEIILSAYTSAFLQELPPWSTKKEVTAAEAAQGWELVTDGKEAHNVSLVKRHTANKVVNGMPYRKGEKLKTW
jgi:hypothetical protein